MTLVVTKMKRTTTSVLSRLISLRNSSQARLCLDQDSIKRPLRIDAISINQPNDDEKALHVREMYCVFQFIAGGKPWRLGWFEEEVRVLFIPQVSLDKYMYPRI